MMTKNYYMADASPGLCKGPVDDMVDTVSSSVRAVQAHDDGTIRSKDIFFKEDAGLTKSHAVDIGPDQLATDSLESSSLLQDSLQETNSYYSGTEKICTESEDISTSSHNISIGDEQSYEIELHHSQFPKSAIIYVTNDTLSSSEGNLFSFPIEDLQQKDVSTFSDGALIFIRSEDISGIHYDGEGPSTNEITQECSASPQTSIVYPSTSELHVANISNLNCMRTDRVNVDQHGLAQTLEIKTKSIDNSPIEEIQTSTETFGKTKECGSINYDVQVNMGEINSSRNTLTQNNAFETLSGVKDMVDDKSDANKASLSVMKYGEFDQGQKNSDTLMSVGFRKDSTDNNLENNNEQSMISEMPISQLASANTEIQNVGDNIGLMEVHALNGEKRQLIASGLNMKSSQSLINTSPANDLARDKKIVFIPMITSQGTTSQILVAKQLSTDAGRVAAEVMPSSCRSKSYALPSPNLSANRELGKCTEGFKLPYHMAGKKLVIIQCQKPVAEIKPFEKISSQRLVNNKGNASTVTPSHGVVCTENQSIFKNHKNTSSVISKVDAATETDESFLMHQKDNTGIGNDKSKKSEVLQSIYSHEKISKSSAVTKSKQNSIEALESVNCIPEMNEYYEGQEVDLAHGQEKDDFCLQGDILTTQSSKKRKINKKEDKRIDLERSEEKRLSFVRPTDKEVDKSLAAHTSIEDNFKKERRKHGKIESETDSKVKTMKANVLKDTECNVSLVKNNSLLSQSYTKRDARRPRVDYKNLNTGVFSLKRMSPSTVFEKHKLSTMKTTDSKKSRNKILLSEENKDKTRSQKSVHLNCELSKKRGTKGSKKELSKSLPETSKVEKRKGRDHSDDEDEMTSSLKPVRKRYKVQGKFKAHEKVLTNKSNLNHPVDTEHDGVVSDGVTPDKDEPQTVVCEWCGKPYASLKSLSAHRKCCKLSPAARPKPHVCEICNKGFAMPLYLKQHAAVHTGIKKYICKVCNKGFSNQGNLYTHMGIHNPNKRFLCAHCGKGFSQHVNLKYHLKTSVGKCAADRKDCPFACEKCGNRFTSNKRLKQHEQIHQKYKIESFSCEYCQRLFKSYPLLERHVRIHTGIKPFKCKICNMAFAQQNNLEAHTLTHSDVRPYHCAICQRGFIQRTNFKTHMWKKHGLAPSILPRMRTKSRKKDASNPSCQFILLENETHASISQGQWTQTVDDGTDADPSIKDSRTVDIDCR
ncbi:hypothetical protein ACJMK2_027310 [Sinanodonta woodiana]|uniref:C2H2-type domain-containing protein n=1 Tax=Sinanodonta woodiana TaxID=1069815 RepID=A0ABD3XQV5_SINWO